MNKLALNVNEAAEMIGISPTTIYSLVKENEIPHTRVRSRIFFHREKLEAWLKGELPVTKEA